VLRLGVEVVIEAVGDGIGGLWIGQLGKVEVGGCLAGLFAVGLRGSWVEGLDGGEDIDLTKSKGFSSRHN